MAAIAHPACDAANAAAEPDATPGVGRRVRPNFVLATCVLASGLAFVDGSVVNVALPTLARELAADAAATQWIVNAYLLPLGALLLIGGAAGDRLGRRRLLIAGTILFAAASLLCTLPLGVTGLLAGRFLQGVGAAMLMPNSLAILGSSFEGEAKGRAIGIWAASGAAMGALGPVLGGWLVDTVGWRTIFLLNLPLAAGAIALSWFFVPRDADRSGPRIDVAGAALATLALAAGSWGLTVGTGSRGWTATAEAAVLIGLLALAAFGWVERRRGDAAMMPPALFGSRTFIGLTLLTAFLYGALGTLFVLLPYVLVDAAGYSGTAAGAALVPLPLVLAIISPSMGRLAARIGPRAPLTIGPLVVAIGFALLTRIDAQAPYAAQVLPAMLVIACGMSGAVAPLTTAVLASVDRSHAGSASGLNSAVARTGGLVATALLGSVLVARGDVLIAQFHAAGLVCALASLLAAACAFLLVQPAQANSPAARPRRVAANP